MLNKVRLFFSDFNLYDALGGLIGMVVSLLAICGALLLIGNAVVFIAKLNPLDIILILVVVPVLLLLGYAYHKLLRKINLP